MISRFRQFKKYDGKGENKKGPTLGGGKRRLEVFGIYTKDLSKCNSPIKQLSSWAEIPRFPVFSEDISHRKISISARLSKPQKRIICSMKYKGFTLFFTKSAENGKIQESMEVI
jgi:hypothetical protein